MSRVEVLKGLDLTVHEGDIVGCLGRNGAGKSTLIRVLMGIVKPDQGQVEVLGLTPHKDVVALRQQIGYLAQEQNFYPWMSTIAIGKFTSRFYPGWDNQGYSRFLDLFELPLKRAVGQFSIGMKAKLALALALASQPRLLLLDEPAAGLDPVARREFLEQVNIQSRMLGTTTFFSSHLIDDIEHIADRVCIIEKGKTFYQGELLPLARDIGAFSREGDIDRAKVLPEFVLENPSCVLQDTLVGKRRRVVIRFSSANLQPDQLASVLPDSWEIDSLSLEDVFVSLLS